MSATTSVQRRRIGTATQVFIGLGLGILVGLFFGEKVAFLQIGGDIFIALLQITVIWFTARWPMSASSSLGARDPQGHHSWTGGAARPVAGHGASGSGEHLHRLEHTYTRQSLTTAPDTAYAAYI